MSLKEKLSIKDRALLKLALWAGLIVWMVFFFAIGLVYSKNLADIIPIAMKGQSPTLVGVMTWVSPIWLIFTTLFIIVVVARWAGRRLK